MINKNKASVGRTIILGIKSSAIAQRIAKLFAKNSAKQKDQIKTKKLLVSYNLKNPDSNRREFLSVAIKNGAGILIGIKTGKIYKHGRVVYIGKNLCLEEFLDSCTREKWINQIDLDRSDRYFLDIQNFKIGNIMIASESGNQSCLTLFSKMGHSKPIKLPD